MTATLAKGVIDVGISGFFTTHHYFDSAAGHWGELTIPAFSNYGVFRTSGGRELLLRKVHWLGSVHEVSEDGILRGRAELRGAFERDMVLNFDGQELLLQAAGLLNQGWYLIDHTIYRLLEVQPLGILRQGARLTLYASMDIGLVAFCYYLVHMRWQENVAVIAATAS